MGIESEKVVGPGLGRNLFFFFFFASGAWDGWDVGGHVSAKSQRMSLACWRSLVSTPRTHVGDDADRTAAPDMNEILLRITNDVCMYLLM